MCDYHEQFYRPENLCLLITGLVKPEDVFERMKSFEEKILSKVSSLLYLYSLVYCKLLYQFKKDHLLLIQCYYRRKPELN